MWNDPIVEETRQLREEYGAQFDYDLMAIYQDIKQQEAQRPSPTVTLPPKQPLQRASKREGLDSAA